MSTNDTDDTAAAKAGYRSRFGRFSPSMGWKAFWSEIIIVVLGVMIALTANEAVENWNWQKKVRDGELRLQADMAELFWVSAEQYAVLPCVEKQLTELSQKIVQSGTAWDPVTITVSNSFINKNIRSRYVVNTPSRDFALDVWNALVADGTTARFSQEMQLYYNSLSKAASDAQNQNDEAIQLARRLLVLGRPMTLNDDSRRYFLVLIEEMYGLATSSAIGATQRMEGIAYYGGAPEAKEVDAGLAESGTVKFCKANGYPLADWRNALKP